jgi:hypothetical protein
MSSIPNIGMMPVLFGALSQKLMVNGKGLLERN